MVGEAPCSDPTESRCELSCLVSSREKHEPKHRAPLGQASPEAALRTSLTLSAMAVVGTGLAVSGRALSPAAPGSRPARSADAGVRDQPPRGGRDRRWRRAEATPRRRAEVVVTRSDRRSEADPLKSAPARPRGRQRAHPHRGPLRRGPAHDRPGPAGRVRLRREPVRLPRLPVGARVALEPARPQPVLGRLRHPAVAARLQDGHAPAPTGAPTRSPRSAGASATSRTATARPAAPGATARATAGTDPVCPWIPSSSGCAPPCSPP